MAEPLVVDRRHFGLLGLGIAAAAAVGVGPGGERRAEAAPAAAPALDTGTPINIGSAIPPLINIT